MPSLISLLLIFVTLLLKNPSPDNPVLGTTTTSSAKQVVHVSRVVDGDTIQLSSGEKLRFIGINAPETVDPRRSVQCFGKEASDKTKALLTDKDIFLEKDISETDKYGRLLRYVWVGDIFVNEYLVREGFAYSSTYPPDTKYQNLFNQAQKLAQKENKGLWGASCKK